MHNNAMHAEPPTARFQMGDHSRRPGDRKRWAVRPGTKVTQVMSMLDESTLQETKSDLLSRSGGIVAFPVAGALYWLVLGICGYMLTWDTWRIVALIGSAMLFPTAFLLCVYWGRTWGSCLLIRRFVECHSVLGLRGTFLPPKWTV